MTLFIILSLLSLCIVLEIRYLIKVKQGEQHGKHYFNSFLRVFHITASFLVLPVAGFSWLLRHVFFTSLQENYKFYYNLNLYVLVLYLPFALLAMHFSKRLEQRQRFVSAGILLALPLLNILISIFCFAHISH